LKWRWLAGPTRAEEYMKRVCGLTSLLALTLALLPACLQHDPDDDLASHVVISGPTRRAPRVLEPTGARAPLAITARRRAASTGATTTFAEDGRGQRIAATDAVIIEVRGPIAARALDPVLHVGDRVFRDARLDRDVVRFVVADAALVPPGAPVRLRYGDDAATIAIVDGDDR
jgi:hypothetical protein